MSRLGRHLEVLHIILEREALGKFEGDLAGLVVLSTEVCFVSDEHLGYGFGRVGLEIGHPELEALEGVLICEVEADQYSTNILIVHAGNVAEPLLASCIPDVKPHNIFDVGVIRVLYLQGLDLKVPG